MEKCSFKTADYKLEDGAEIKELAAFIHDIIRKYYPKLYTELSLNNIDSYLAASTIEQVTVPNQIDNEDSVPTEFYSYLTKMYGNNEDVRSLAEITVYQNLVKHTLINREGEYEIEDDTQLNKELQKYQTQLFNNIIYYLKTYAEVTDDILTKLDTYNVFNESDFKDVNELAKIYLPLNLLKRF